MQVAIWYPVGYSISVRRTHAGRMSGPQLPRALQLNLKSISVGYHTPEACFSGSGKKGEETRSRDYAGITRHYRRSLRAGVGSVDPRRFLTMELLCKVQTQIRHLRAWLPYLMYDCA